MAEKDMRNALLLDFYGEMLSATQREMLTQYYNEDLTLSEIAEQTGITRQGVRDAVRRAEEALHETEERLHFVQFYQSVKSSLDEAVAIGEGIRERNEELHDGALDDLSERLLCVLKKISL